MFSLQIPVKMDYRFDESPRPSMSGEMLNTVNNDFTTCKQDFGIYGWRKKCLYLLVILLTAMVIINVAMLVWIIRVMDFTVDGMGKLRITKKGIRVEGEAEFMSSVHASRLQTQQEVPLLIQSSTNITMSVYGNNGRRTNSLFIGDSYIEARCDEFKICDNNENILFEANKDEILFAVNTLRLPDNPETNQGGLVFDGSIQTNLLHSGLHHSLRLQAPTRKIYVSGPEGVSIEAKAGEIRAVCSKNLKLESKDGYISLSARNIEFKNLMMSDPDTSTENGPPDKKDSSSYQLCVCENGKLFLSPPSENCKADVRVCE